MSDSFDTFCANQQARILKFLAQREEVYNQRMTALRYEQGKKECTPHLLFDCPVCSNENDHESREWLPKVGDTERAWINPKWEMEHRK